MLIRRFENLTQGCDTFTVNLAVCQIYRLHMVISREDSQKETEVLTTNVIFRHI